VTLDFLGENVNNRTMADKMVARYVRLFDNIGAADIDSTISVKLTMLGLDIGMNYCRDNLFTLLDVARRHDQFVRIDMESSDYTQRTIELFKDAFRTYGGHVGIVLQAYLHRTREDVTELAEMGADVRMCKGAYDEPEEIALQNMNEIREAFKAHTRILLKKTACPRIATHDDKLIDWTRNYTTDHHIGMSRFEFQMLYGLRQDTMERLARNGFNTRIYVPFGTMWFPYFKRRLTERKENIWFVLSTLFKK
ncbi:MAG TPA: proline dehydrogenase family protein, partial [Fodinibius sp.]|nr:proline dehydrogenase family protein [Fodinibius sp.]